MNSSMFISCSLIVIVNEKPEIGLEPQPELGKVILSDIFSFPWQLIYRVEC